VPRFIPLVKFFPKCTKTKKPCECKAYSGKKFAPPIIQSCSTSKSKYELIEEVFLLKKQI